MIFFLVISNLLLLLLLVLSGAYIVSNHTEVEILREFLANQEEKEDLQRRYIQEEFDEVLPYSIDRLKFKLYSVEENRRK